LHGANPKPQLPMTTLVTPCQPDMVHQGSQKTWLGGFKGSAQLLGEPMRLQMTGEVAKWGNHI
jgi:hypothetical protein